MNVLDVILIGVALSMDACALTIANCSAYKSVFSEKKSWAMPVFFAIFQGIMPLIGFFVGKLFAKYLETYSGFIVATVFIALAIKIIIDTVKERRKKIDETNCESKSLTYPVILIQALATSIDALVVGVTMSMNLELSVFVAVLLITGITAVLVTASLVLGKYVGKLLGKYAEWFGAVILLALALKTLLETLL